ncbi:MAG: COQ9 family protein [Alphaproteobacteria bacterium]|nr:COQ9 family protein [Alphaproteobacteria bacterium]
MRPIPHPDADRFIEALVPHIPFDGWSRAAVRLAAEDTNLSMIEVDGLFPIGIPQMVEYYLDKRDRDLEEKLKETDLGEMRIRDRIAFAVRSRLEMAEDEVETVRRTLSWFGLPFRSASAAKTLYRTVDTIWHVCGDRSTDFNFYTKRGLLAGVYSSTLLYWLQDSSPDHEATWAFLARRIENVMQIPKLTDRIAAMAPNPGRFARAFRRGAARS